jgi:hypothetical protein
MGLIRRGSRFVLYLLCNVYFYINFWCISLTGLWRPSNFLFPVFRRTVGDIEGDGSDPALSPLLWVGEEDGCGATSQLFAPSKSAKVSRERSLGRQSPARPQQTSVTLTLPGLSWMLWRGKRSCSTASLRQDWCTLHRVSLVLLLL